MTVCDSDDTDNNVANNAVVCSNVWTQVPCPGSHLGRQLLRPVGVSMCLYKRTNIEGTFSLVALCMQKEYWRILKYLDFFTSISTVFKICLYVFWASAIFGWFVQMRIVFSNSTMLLLATGQLHNVTWRRQNWWTKLHDGNAQKQAHDLVLIFTRDSIYAIARICHANSVCPSVRLSVRPSHACIVSKRLNVSSKFFHHLIGPTS